MKSRITLQIKLITILSVSVLVLYTTGCSESSAEKNKRIVREVYKNGINAHNMSYMDSILADNYTRHSQSSPPGMQEIKDKKTFLNFIKTHFEAFPDWNEDIEFMVAEDDKVAFLTTGTGINSGNLGEMFPTGKSVNLQNMIVHRIDENNQIAETWVLWDNVAFLSQLGLYPPAVEKAKN
jgi:predicted ester cyclase